MFLQSNIYSDFKVIVNAIEDVPPVFSSQEVYEDTLNYGASVVIHNIRTYVGFARKATEFCDIRDDILDLIQSVSDIMTPIADKGWSEAKEGYKNGDALVCLEWMERLFWNRPLDAFVMEHCNLGYLVGYDVDRVRLSKSAKGALMSGMTYEKAMLGNAVTNLINLQWGTHCTSFKEAGYSWTDAGKVMVSLRDVRCIDIGVYNSDMTRWLYLVKAMSKHTRVQGEEFKGVIG